MLYYYFFNMLKVGVPGFTQTPQLLVYNLKNDCTVRCSHFYTFLHINRRNIHTVQLAHGLVYRLRCV